MITENKIRFFSIFSSVAKDILQKLLTPDPSQRLGSGPNGIQDIKEHAFFTGIDWEAMAERKVEPTFIPKVEDDLDLSNIDNYFTSEEPKETPTERVSQLEDCNENFEDFTYKEK